MINNLFKKWSKWQDVGTYYSGWHDQFYLLQIKVREDGLKKSRNIKTTVSHSNIPSFEDRILEIKYETT